MHRKYVKRYPGVKVMKNFWPFLRLEFNTLLHRRKFIPLFLFYFIALSFLQLGVSEFKHYNSQEFEFKKSENTRISKYNNYRQYGGYGFSSFYSLHPMATLMNDSGIFIELNTQIDSGSGLKIFQPLNGKNLFKLKKSELIEFRGFIILIGAFIVLIYGYEAFANEELLKSISTLLPFKRVYLFFLFARLFVIFKLLIILFVLAFFVLLLNGVVLPIDSNLISLFLVQYIVLIFFFLLGSSIRPIKRRISSWAVPFVFWLFFFFLIPIFLDSLSSFRSEDITPISRIENMKLKILMEYEGILKTKYGPLKESGYPPNDAQRIDIKNYMNIQLKEIEKVEQSLFNQLSDRVRDYHFLSMLFPTTFNRVVSQETGSMGYGCFLSYYKHSMNLKSQFVRFILDRVYFSNNSRVEPFLNGKTSIYHSKSQLPSFFFLGLLFNLIWIGMATFFSYRGFKQRIFIEPPREFDFKNVFPVKLEKKRYTTLYIIFEDIKYRLYNLLSGIKTERTLSNFKNHMFIGKQDVTQIEKPMDFFFLCHPRELMMDCTVEELILFFCRIANAPANIRYSIMGKDSIAPNLKVIFNDLEYFRKNEIFLQLLSIKKSPIYFVDDIGKDMPPEFQVLLHDTLMELSKSGAYVLLLTTTADIFFSINPTTHPGYIERTNRQEQIEFYKEEQRKSDKESTPFKDKGESIDE